MPVPSSTLTKRFSFVGGDGSPLLGESFSVIGYDPSGALLAPSVPVELGNGVYEFSVPTTIADPIGSYYLQVTSSTLPVQVKEHEWIVKPLGTPDRWRPGDTVMDAITVIDVNSVPVLGDTFTIVAYNTVGKQVTVSPPTEVGNGMYRVAVKTSRFDPPGNYYVQLTSNSLPTQTYEVEFVIGQPVYLTGGTTLRELRRSVMSRFGDIVSLTATQDSDTYSIIDEDNIVGEPGRYAGREILFATGMNAGQRRYVNGSSRDTASVRFGRPLPYPVAIGDEADMTNAHSIGLSYQAIEAAINWAINTSRSRALVPITYRVEEWDGTAIPIPVEAVGVNDVYAIDAHGEQRHIRRSNSRPNGWFIDKPTRTIVVNGHERDGAKGMTIVVNAYSLPSMLVDDDDVTHIDFEWLVDTATAHLCLDTLLSRQASGDWGSKGMLYQQRADQRVTRLTPNIGPNYQAVG